MLTKRLILLIAIVVFSNNQVKSQTNQQELSIEKIDHNVRKIEVAAYSVANLKANEVYVSFSTKEFEQNGKTVTLEDQEKKLKQAVKDIGYDEKNLKVMNLVGYNTFTMTGDEGAYQKTRSYLLKLRGINCIDKFLLKTDMKHLNNFTIESFDHDDIFKEIRKIQLDAFQRAKEKADDLLASYGEKRGGLLSVQEVSLHVIYPKVAGLKGNLHKVIGINSGTIYTEMTTNNLHEIQIEYLAKVVFEITSENDKNNK